MATVADVGFVAGPDQACTGCTTPTCTRRFSSGNVNGQFVDLKHRWRGVPDPVRGLRRPLPGADELEATARTSLARRRYNRANYASPVVSRIFPSSEFSQFAREIDPAPAGVARRERCGAASRVGYVRRLAGLHPLWAPARVGAPGEPRATVATKRGVGNGTAWARAGAADARRPPETRHHRAGPLAPAEPMLIV